MGTRVGMGPLTAGMEHPSALYRRSSATRYGRNQGFLPQLKERAPHPLLCPLSNPCSKAGRSLHPNTNKPTPTHKTKTQANTNKQQDPTHPPGHNPNPPTPPTNQPLNTHHPTTNKTKKKLTETRNNKRPHPNKTPKQYPYNQHHTNLPPPTHPKHPNPAEFPLRLSMAMIVQR